MVPDGGRGSNPRRRSLVGAPGHGKVPGLTLQVVRCQICWVMYFETECQTVQRSRCRDPRRTISHRKQGTVRILTGQPGPGNMSGIIGWAIWGKGLAIMSCFVSVVSAKIGAILVA